MRGKERIIGAIMAAGFTFSSANGYVDAEKPDGNVIKPVIAASVPDWEDTIRLPEVPIIQPPEKSYIANNLSIPSIGVSSSEIIVTTFDESLGTYPTPDYGIASPYEIRGHLSNRILLYSHSSWQNKSQPFSNLQNMELGEEVFVDTFEIEASKVEMHENMRFVVTEMKILDKENAVNALFGKPNPVYPEVLLLTTLREAGGEYILNMEMLQRKAIEKIDYENYDNAGPLWFLVRAVQEK